MLRSSWRTCFHSISSGASTTRTREAPIRSSSLRVAQRQSTLSKPRIYSCAVSRHRIAVSTVCFCTSCHADCPKVSRPANMPSSILMTRSCQSKTTSMSLMSRTRPCLSDCTTCEYRAGTSGADSQYLRECRWCKEGAILHAVCLPEQDRSTLQPALSYLEWFAQGGGGQIPVCR